MNERSSKAVVLAHTRPLKNLTALLDSVEERENAFPLRSGPGGAAGRPRAEDPRGRVGAGGMPGTEHRHPRSAPRIGHQGADAGLPVKAAAVVSA